MADIADTAADLQAAEIASSIEHARAQLAGTRRVVACIDCRDSLTPARSAMGACRCVECQREREREASRHGRR